MPSGSTIFFAPNIHSGGGGELILSLIKSNIDDNVIFFCDKRIREKVISLGVDKGEFIWVSPSIYSRVQAQVLLRKKTKSNDVVFCFNGVPPLFGKVGSKLILFIQNRFQVENNFSKMKSITIARTLFEKLARYYYLKNIDYFVLQTPSMKYSLINAIGIDYENKILEIPFFPKINCKNIPSVKREKIWDFVYVADSLPHKNHKNLIEAWVLLHREGINLSLILTVDKEELNLDLDTVKYIDNHDVNIKFLGKCSRDEVDSIYLKARDLIYPSLLESFGLPLIEANRFELGILAAELDYVRDVCSPKETFNPYSPLSISRAVKRYNLKREDLITIQEPNVLWGFLESQKKDE